MLLPLSITQGLPAVKLVGAWGVSIIVDLTTPPSPTACVYAARSLAPHKEGRGVIPAFSRILSPSLFMGEGLGVGALSKEHQSN